MIVVRDLRKTYRVPQRDPGFAGALRSLWKRTYKEVRAVDGISFDIAPGERVGFLGPNGAGKTTTLKMLAGLLRPTAGTLEVQGHRPAARAVEFLEQITLVMGQKQQLLWDLPPRDTFELNRALYQIPDAQFRETLAELTEMLSLGELVARPTRNLSLGERMKCELAAALLHRPRVLFLDEPTIGLDVVMQIQVRQFIAQWNERFRSTVLLTSHYMDDVQALCPRVLVIDQGVLRFDGLLVDLVTRMKPLRRVLVRLPRDFTGGLPEPFRAEGESWVADVAPAEVGPAVQGAFARCPGLDLRVEEPPLEQVFAAFFQERKAT